MPKGVPPCEDCGGASVADERCIGHLSRRQRASYEEQVAATGFIDGRGANCTAQQLESLIHTANHGAAEGVTLLLLQQARISGDVRIPDLKVTRFCSFKGARFDGAFRVGLFASCPVEFSHAIFGGDVELSGVATHDLRFSGTDFGGALAFTGLQVAGNALFFGPRFASRMDIAHLSMGRGIHFANLTFPGPFVWSDGRTAHELEEVADRTEARMRADQSSWRELLPPWAPDELIPDLIREHGFVLDEAHGGIYFRDVRFTSRARIYLRIFGGECVFDDVRFCDLSDFQKALLKPDHLLITSSRFDQRLAMDVDGLTFDCISNNFADGADLSIGCDSAVIEGCRFGQASVIRRHASGDSSAVTHLDSLRRTNCEHVRLLEMDLTACRFSRAHNLDKLVVEGEPALISPPPPTAASRRKIIADEWDWRAEHDGWDLPPRLAWEDIQSARFVPLDQREALDATEIAALYRALRKGREDSKDEPGASDFYYGEMEMRRRSSVGGQRLVLWAYWFLSGYGLRPSRTLASIVVTLALFASLFQAGGFADTAPQLRPVRVESSGALVYERTAPERTSAIEKGIDAAAYTAGTATTIISGPERRLTRFGRVLRVLLRVVGPVLIALLILSIRGRVKR